MWRAAIGVLLGVLLGAAAVSCGDVKSGPNTPLSIEFRPPQLPSMLVHDELHDTLGNIDSLRAITFNSSGDTIQDAPIRYVRADTSLIVTIDSISGHVTATDTGLARVVAQTSGLQSPPDSLWVVERPETFANITLLDDTLTVSGGRRDTIFALSTALMAAIDPVDHWRIEYSIVYPAEFNTSDSSRVFLSDENRKFSLVDTTGASLTGISGSATRYLRVSPFARNFVDSVVVEARAFYPDHTVVPGSPLRFKVLVQIQ